MNIFKLKTTKYTLVPLNFNTPNPHPPLPPLNAVGGDVSNIPQLCGSIQPEVWRIPYCFKLFKRHEGVHLSAGPDVSSPLILYIVLCQQLTVQHIGTYIFDCFVRLCVVTYT
jgi:hypothetical protein